MFWGINELASLEDGGNSEDSRSRNFGFAALDRSEKSLSSIVDSLINRSETFCIRCPQKNDLVEVAVGFEVANVLLNDFHLFLLGSSEDIVSTFSMVGSNEIREVQGREWNHILHAWVELVLQVLLEDLGTLHGIAEVHL